MFSALEIANYFIKLAKKHGKGITNMKLKKLVYISHGLFLAIKKLPLIDEYVQAWEYGPVIPSIYHSFKIWGNKEIKDYHREIMDDNEMIPMVDGKEIQEFLDAVWYYYSKFSAFELSQLTHQEGSPWKITIGKNNDEVKRGKSIDNNIIKEYYSGKLENVER